VPLGEVATLELTRGATSICTENGQLTVYIGHSTADIMASAQFDEMENVMRAAVRFLNERARILPPNV
jgi:Cu/Ag efflux pump CusA